MKNIDRLFKNARNAIAHNEHGAALVFVLELIHLLASANKELYKFYLEKRRADAKDSDN